LSPLTYDRRELALTGGVLQSLVDGTALLNAAVKPLFGACMSTQLQYSVQPTSKGELIASLATALFVAFLLSVVRLYGMSWPPLPPSSFELTSNGTKAEKPSVSSATMWRRFFLLAVPL
jgi:hypothetical protein